MIDHPAARQPYPTGDSDYGLAFATPCPVSGCVQEYRRARPGMYRAKQEATGRQEVTETSGDPCEGRLMPNFELPDHELLPFDLYQTLREGPLVLVFYRGDW